MSGDSPEDSLDKSQFINPIEDRPTHRLSVEFQRMMWSDAEDYIITPAVVKKALVDILGRKLSVTLSTEYTRGVSGGIQKVRTDLLSSAVGAVIGHLRDLGYTAVISDLKKIKNLADREKESGKQLETIYRAIQLAYDEKIRDNKLDVAKVYMDLIDRQ